MAITNAWAQRRCLRPCCRRGRFFCGSFCRRGRVRWEWRLSRCLSRQLAGAFRRRDGLRFRNRWRVGGKLEGVSVGVEVSPATGVSVLGGNSVGVAVGVSLSTGVSEAVAVSVAGGTGVAVSEGIAVAVGVTAGVSVVVGVSVGTSTGVTVGNGVSVGSSTGVPVGVEVSPATGVSVPGGILSASQSACRSRLMSARPSLSRWPAELGLVCP